MGKLLCICGKGKHSIDLETRLNERQPRTVRITRCSCCRSILEEVDWSYRRDPYVEISTPGEAIEAYDAILFHAGVRLAQSIARGHKKEERALRRLVMNCSRRVYKLMLSEGLLKEDEWPRRRRSVE